jgi:hypothetical protein
MSQASICLRLEPQNGSRIEEYRVSDGRVEVRRVGSYDAYDPPENTWQGLTPQQLRTHVERNTAVAQWLKRRLGWRRLLQACVAQEPPPWRDAENGLDQEAA